MKSSYDSRNSSAESDLDSLLYLAMLSAGEIPPITEAEIEFALRNYSEAEFDHADLSEPPVEQEPQYCASQVVFQPDPTTIENLACAARNGKQIDSETQMRMRLDRQTAEHVHRKFVPNRHHHE